MFTGKIDLSNAEQYYQKGLQLIRKQQLPLVVNLARYEHGILALWPFWCNGCVRRLKTKGLQFKAVPEKMMKIIQACHLQDDLQLIA